jgi:hypothetical protein
VRRAPGRRRAAGRFPIATSSPPISTAEAQTRRTAST